MSEEFTLLVATQNVGKFSEIVEVLGDLKLKLFYLKSEDIKAANGKLVLEIAQSSQFEETGETFEENAVQKAMHYAELTGLTTIGEDSGIIVDAFKGELGVKTRRWGAGEHASDEEWIAYFMERMKQVPPEERTACFVCAAALKYQEEILIFRGETKGVITPTLEVPIKKGIPLSSCFRPDGYDKVYAALTEHEKNKVSHRGKAFHELKNYLVTSIIQTPL